MSTEKTSVDICQWLSNCCKKNDAQEQDDTQEPLLSTSKVTTYMTYEQKKSTQIVSNKTGLSKTTEHHNDETKEKNIHRIMDSFQEISLAKKTHTTDNRNIKEFNVNDDNNAIDDIKNIDKNINFKKELIIIVNDLSKKNIQWKQIIDNSIDDSIGNVMEDIANDSFNENTDMSKINRLSCDQFAILLLKKLQLVMQWGNVFKTTASQTLIKKWTYNLNAQNNHLKLLGLSENSNLNLYATIDELPKLNSGDVIDFQCGAHVVVIVEPSENKKDTLIADCWCKTENDISIRPLSDVVNTMNTNPNLIYSGYHNARTLLKNASQHNGNQNITLNKYNELNQKYEILADDLLDNKNKEKEIHQTFYSLYTNLGFGLSMRVSRIAYLRGVAE